MLSVKVTLCSALAGARKFTALHGTSSTAWESLGTLAHSQGVSQENTEPPQSVSTSSWPLCVPWWGRHLTWNFGWVAQPRHPLGAPVHSCHVLWDGPDGAGMLDQVIPSLLTRSGSGCVPGIAAGGAAEHREHTRQRLQLLMLEMGKVLQISFSCSEIQWAI